MTSFSLFLNFLFNRPHKQKKLPEPADEIHYQNIYKTTNGFFFAFLPLSSFLFFFSLSIMTKNEEVIVPSGSILQVDSPEPTLLRVETLDPG